MDICSWGNRDRRGGVPCTVGRDGAKAPTQAFRAPAWWASSLEPQVLSGGHAEAPLPVGMEARALQASASLSSQFSSHCLSTS